MGSLFLLQGVFQTQGSNLGGPNCRQIPYQLSHQGSPGILEWVAYTSSSRSFWPRNRTRSSCIARGFFNIWNSLKAVKEEERPLSPKFPSYVSRTSEFSYFRLKLNLANIPSNSRITSCFLAFYKLKAENYLVPIWSYKHFPSNTHLASFPTIFSHSLCSLTTECLLWPGRLCAHLLCWNTLPLDTHTASSFPSPRSLLKCYLMRGLLPWPPYPSSLLFVSLSLTYFSVSSLLFDIYLFGNLFTISLSPSGGEAS